MAHNYVITSVTHVGDAVTVAGSVDGVTVLVTCSFADLTSFPNVLTARAFLANLMLAALPLPLTPINLPLYVGSFSQ